MSWLSFGNALSAFGADLFDAATVKMTWAKALIVAALNTGAMPITDHGRQRCWPNVRRVGGIVANATQLGNGIGHPPWSSAWAAAGMQTAPTRAFGS
ncbi:MAG: hypothetical protein IPO15_20915 [Anaerolineae bacterium]|uniref:hypothetical protein n=1 Tax=Candidatus Amarolinea dominans TaxID=3140696 RepID=UPI0031374E89|nr:hypothetical protein [Anaerolineae bacterium]